MTSPRFQMPGAKHIFFCLALFTSYMLHSQTENDPKADSLSNLLNSALADTTRVKILNELAVSTTRMQPQLGLQYAKQAFSLASEIENDNLKAESLYNVGRAFVWSDIYDSALTVLIESEKLARLAENEQLVIEAIVEQGYVHNINGRMKEAFETMFDVLRILDSVDRYYEIKANLLIDIGELYRSQQDGANAIKYYEQGREIAIEHNFIRTMMRADGNSVIALKQLNKLEEALEISGQMIEKYSSVLNANDIGRVYSNMGGILMDMERWNEAEEVLMKAWDFRKDLDLPRSRAYTLKELGYLYNQTNQPEKAVWYNEQAYDIVKDMDFPFLMRDITGTLADAHQKLGNHKRAFEILKEQRTYRDQLMELERLELSQEMEKKYEAEKREQQIALQKEQLLTQEARLSQAATLRNALIGGLGLLFVIVGLIYRNERLKTRKNKEIEAKNEVIEKSLGEKESLLKEIHHRVKNNLQVISSLLNMQSREASDPEMLDVIKEGQSRVKAMSLIHQKLYQTDNLSEIDFEEYSQQLIDQLAALYKKEGLKLDKAINARDIKLDIDTAIPLGLILNELISNSFKYAFDGLEKGEIKVDLERLSSEDLRLTVSDNGSGLPGDFSMESVKSLGLKLVNILTKQLKGDMNFTSDHGAQFEIKFKDLRMSA